MGLFCLELRALFFFLAVRSGGSVLEKNLKSEELTKCLDRVCKSGREDSGLRELFVWKSCGPINILWKKKEKKKKKILEVPSPG